jgi:hypothetical protein
VTEVDPQCGHKRWTTMDLLAAGGAATDLGVTRQYSKMAHYIPTKKTHDAKALAKDSVT